MTKRLGLFLLLIAIPSTAGAVGESSLCYLSGTGGRAGDTVQQGLGSVSSMIRLRFDAENFEDCRIQVMGYCNQRIREGYRFETLRGRYRSGTDNHEERIFSVQPGNCAFLLAGS